MSGIVQIMGNKSFWDNGLFDRIGDIVVKAMDSATQVVDAASKALDEHNSAGKSSNHTANGISKSDVANEILNSLTDNSDKEKATARDMLASRFLNIVSQAAKSGSEKWKNRKRVVDGMYLNRNTLVSIDNNVKTLVVPEDVHEVDEKVVTSHCNKLESITFEGNIRRIGNRAFDGADHLKTVRFKGNVEFIGNEAFRGCTSLVSVVFEKGLSGLEDSVFEYCISLHEIHLPDNCASLGNSVFCSCASLQQLRLPDNCLSIGNRTFSGCSSLTKVHLPRYLKVIPAWTFEFCFKLVEIDWPEERIEDGHSYPVMENLAFMYVMTEECCEKFVLRDGVMVRRLVSFNDEDPRGCFNMLESGRTDSVGVIPQLLMNATINVAWEIQPEPEYYEFQMDILRTCMSLADIVTANIDNENRAERLYAMSVIRRFQCISANLSSSFTQILLPFVISETLFAVGGNGTNRSNYSKELVNMARIYYKNSEATDESFDENKSKIDFLTRFLNSLSIRSDVPFLFDPYSYRYTIPLTEKDGDDDCIKKDYYGMLFGMKSMFEYQYRGHIAMDEDLSNEPTDIWLRRLGQLLSEKTDQQLHLVLISPGKYISDDMKNSELYEILKPVTDICRHPEAEYATMLTRTQIDDICAILSKFEFEGMLTDYSPGFRLL